MQHVKPFWLKICNYGFMLVSIGLFSIYLAFEYFGVDATTKSKWGVEPTVLVIALIHAAYSLLIYPFFNKRFTVATNFVSLALYAFVLVALIETSGNVNLTYRLAFAAIVFLMGLNGWVSSVVCITLTWVVMVFTIVGVVTPTKASVLYNFTINVIVTIAGFAGYMVFRRYYVKRSDKETQAIAGMLEQEQSKSNVILESINDGVMVMSPAGTVQVINQSAARMLGWPQEEALHLDYRSLFEVIDSTPTNSDTTTAIELGLKSSTTEQKVSYLKTKHNRQLYVDIVASPIFQTTTQPETNQELKKFVGVIAILRDVDTQKRQEQQRSDFISTASHEMRTPVAAIQGFVELALNTKVSVIDDKARGYLEKADAATKQLGELFQDLLTTSQSDDGRLVNNPTLIEVGTLLAELIEQSRPKADEKQLQLVLDTGSGNSKTVAPLLYVNADPDRLREVLRNIIENAIKYTPKGMVTVGASLKDQGVVIRVSDTGMGIAEEDIPHLFQKFYRTDNTATREIGGTGLGLYICKQIVELIGGKIWVESTVGAGSTFFVEIPRVSPENIPKNADHTT